MKSGLYACAGASATARAAACAKRFDEPITNESKVYFGFRPSMRGLGFGSGSGLPLPPSRTTSSMRRSSPVASRTAASIRPRKCPSIHSRAKSLGTRSMNASSVRSRPSASENHVRYVDSLSALRSRSDTSVHRSSALSSCCWLSTPVEKLLWLAAGKRGEHSSVATLAQRPLTTGPERTKVRPLQAFRAIPQAPPQPVEKQGATGVYIGENTPSAGDCSSAVHVPLLWKSLWSDGSLY